MEFGGNILNTFTEDVVEPKQTNKLNGISILKPKSCVMLVTFALRHHPLHGPDQPAVISAVIAHFLSLWHHRKSQRASTHTHIHTLSHAHKNFAVDSAVQ